MPVARRLSPWASLLRLLSAAFVLALMVGNASASLTPQDHAAVCKCGMNCRPEACCCGPKKTAPRTEPQPEPADAPAETPEAASGPCLGAAPCDDDVATPVKAVTVGTGRAALAAFHQLRAASRGDRLPPPSSDDGSSSTPTQLDRPPKAGASA